MAKYFIFNKLRLRITQSHPQEENHSLDRSFLRCVDKLLRVCLKPALSDGV